MSGYQPKDLFSLFIIQYVRFNLEFPYKVKLINFIETCSTRDQKQNKI